MILTEIEKSMILAHRKEQQKRKEIVDKQKNCKHIKRVYSGHSHNDSAYDCVECGHVEWR